MSGSGSAAGAAGGGRAEWQRIYDRVEAQVEELAAGRSRLEEINRIQHEFWDARDKINQARLHQVSDSSDHSALSPVLLAWVSLRLMLVACVIDLSSRTGRRS